MKTITFLKLALIVSFLNLQTLLAVNDVKKVDPTKELVTVSKISPCVDPDKPVIGTDNQFSCLGSTSTLEVLSGNLNDATDWFWYSGSCGGTLVGTGTLLFVTPTVTTTYYIRGEGGCIVPGLCQDSITIYVEQPVSITSQPSSTSSCETAPVNFGFSATGGDPFGNFYLWFVDAGSGFTALSDDATYSGVETQNLSISSVSASMNGYSYKCRIVSNCSPVFFTNAATLTVLSSSVTVNPLSASGCEGSSTSFVAAATGDITGQNWQFSSNGGSTWSSLSNGSVYGGVTTNTLTITGLTASQNNLMYRCHYSTSCIPAGKNSTGALLTVNSCGGPQLTAPFCGATLAALNQVISYTPVAGATNYRVEFSNSSQPLTVVYVRTNPSTSFLVSQVSGLQYGRTYAVRVAAYVNGSWGAYGSACTITTPAVSPTAQLTPASCGVTVVSLSQQLNFNSVPGASNYRIEVTGTSPTFSYVFMRGDANTFFLLTQIPGLQYGRTYNVRVSPYVGGIWESYGSSCTVTTPAVVPSTQLIAGSCGTTVANLTQFLYYTAVPGASNYRIEVSSTLPAFSYIFMRGDGNTFFSLSQIPGIQMGRTYNVRIAPYVGGNWAAYGTVCTVATAVSSIDTKTSLTELASKPIVQSEENNQEELSFSVYPNPTDGKFYIHLKEGAQVLVYNLLGEAFVNDFMQAGLNEIVIEKPAGIYYVSVVSGSNHRVVKLVKQ